jgi:hypothetical protein
MFSPDKTIKNLLDSAYLSGSDFAAAIYSTAPVPDDPVWREQACDVHCQAIVRAVATVPHINIDSIGQGIFASVYSGFTDCWRHMTMPAEDAEAIAQAGEEISAAMQITQASDGIFLSPEERRLAPRFNGSNPEQEGLAVEFALETVQRPLSPHRLLQMAKALYEAEVGDASPAVRVEVSSNLRTRRVG